ncbi:MAG: hypothetical protein R3211_02695 [Balneolaceae bacterium]|nr:hypothetical protein [Balneolaceae bacterium]
MEYLNKFKNLDEISVGNGYNNIVVDKYMWKKDIALTEAGVPQILVLKRSYTPINSTNLPFKIVNSEKVLYRRVGVNSIISFNREMKSIKYQKEILFNKLSF